MKPLLLLSLCAILSGCASDEGPTAEEVRDQFQRGLSGQGHIVPMGNPDDPVKPDPNRPSS